jgi:glycosyltransferase involved in cell wall biosynthesis
LDSARSAWAEKNGVGEVADITTVSRTLLDGRAKFAGASAAAFAPAFARLPLTVMIAVPTLEGGAADEDAVELAGTLTAAGHRALVVSSGGRLEGELAARGAQLVQLDMASRNPAVIAHNAFALARLIRQRHCGVVHALARAPGWSAFAAARMTGVPFVTSWYGEFRDQNRLKHAYNSVMARGEQVIALSEEIADVISERYHVPADRLVVVPSQVDIARFEPASVSAERIAAARAAWGAGPGTRVIMVVGRILRRMGHHVVVQAASRLKDMGLRDFTFVLTGEDTGHSSYSGELWDLVMATKTTDVFRIAGPPADGPAAYMAATAVVSAAVQLESPQRGLLEAMAMGRPVIVSDLAGSDTVVAPPAVAEDRMTGWRFRSGDDNALAAALIRMLSATEAARLAVGRRGRERARELFANPAVPEQMLSIYTEIARPPR